MEAIRKDGSGAAPGDGRWPGGTGEAPEDAPSPTEPEPARSAAGAARCAAPARRAPLRPPPREEESRGPYGEDELGDEAPGSGGGTGEAERREEGWRRSGGGGGGAAAPAGDAEPKGARAGTGAKAARHPWDAFFSARPSRSQDGDSLREGSAGEDGEPPARRGREVGRGRDGDLGRRGAGRPVKPDDERVSHLLGRILRYHAESAGLTPDEDGYVSVSELLCSVPELAHTTEEDIRRVVKESISSKGPRFELRDGSQGEPEVRATYKHPKEARRLPAERRGPRGRYAGWGFGFGRGFPPPYGFPPFGPPFEYPRRGFSQLPPPDEEEWSDEEDDARQASARARVGEARPQRGERQLGGQGRAGGRG